MNCIVAADRDWGIGRNNQLLVSIPGDMKYFREKTRGKILIMGRKTLESFPGGQPLKGRINIVITGHPDSLDPSLIRLPKGADPKEAMRKVPPGNALLVSSPEEALSAAEAFEPDDVFVIGGGSIYRTFLPFCRLAYVTKIDYRYDADTRFPDLDRDPAWELVSEGEEQTCFDLVYSFLIYRNRAL